MIEKNKLVKDRDGYWFYYIDSLINLDVQLFLID